MPALSISFVRERRAGWLANCLALPVLFKEASPLNLEQKFPAHSGENPGGVIMSCLLLPEEDAGQASPCLARCEGSEGSYSLQPHPRQELLPH